MSDTDEYPILEDPLDPRRPDSKTFTDTGRIEYDQLGNPIWVPHRNLASSAAVARLLNDDSLAITDEEAQTTLPRIQPNPGGLRKGYDPYQSGLLVKQERRRKRDLRALSAWIAAKKRAESKDD